MQSSSPGSASCCSTVAPRRKHTPYICATMSASTASGMPTKSEWPRNALAIALRTSAGLSSSAALRVDLVGKRTRA
eukprot:354799-Chlamydomonas_euryale.AAC.6